jgi:hydroxyacylglutathione hydrolase
MLSAFAGWFISEGQSIALVASSQGELEMAHTHLMRIALDRILGGYTGVVPAAAQGAEMAAIPMVDTAAVAQRLKQDESGWTLLDVRDAYERESGAIEGSQHIYVGELADRFGELDPQRPYTVMCASGMRASVAAGWLSAKGFANVDIYLGSMGAWKAAHG